MKLYLLKGTKGSWDSYYPFNVGIYSTLEEAEKEKEKLIQELTILSEKYTRQQKEKYEEELEDLYYDSNGADDDDDITLPDYLKEYQNWCFRWEFEEYNLNEFQIIEMELNKSYFYD